MKEKGKEKYGKWEKIEVILAVIFVGQILFLMAMNFAYMREMVDYDSSGAFSRAREMFRQGKLLTDDWGYQTTIDVDSIIGVVGIVYGITKDVFFSQALVNNIMILAYVYVVWHILTELKVSIKARLIGEMVYFVPYSLGQLGYLSMLFVNAASYTVRAFIPLLLLSILIDIQNKKRVKSYIIRLLSLTVIVCFAGFSSGVYTLFCGILPFLAVEVIAVIYKDDIKSILNPRVIVLVIILGVGFLGVFSERFFGLSTKATEMVLVDATNWFDNIFSYFVGIYELLGGVAQSGEVRLFSRSGISILGKWALTSAILFSALYFVAVAVKRKKVELHWGYIWSVFMVNFFVLTLLYTTYGGGTFEFRYHLIPMLPVFLFIPFFLDEILKRKNELFKLVIIAGAVMLILADTLIGDYAFAQVSKNGNPKKLKEIDAYLMSQNVETAIFYGENQVMDGRIIRALGESVDYIVVENGIAMDWGMSKKRFDNAKQTGRLAIITDTQEYKEIPSYLKKDAQYVNTIYDKEIYIAKQSKFDFVSGFSKRAEKTIDFPYTYGCLHANAELDEDGILVSNDTGGTIFWGLNFDGTDGRFSYTLHYRITNEGETGQSAKFMVKKDLGAKCIKKISLDPHETSVTLEFEMTENDQGVGYSVTIPKGMIIEIESIEMEVYE